MCCQWEIAHYLCEEVIHSNQTHLYCSIYYQSRKHFNYIESPPLNRHPGKSRCIYRACEKVSPVLMLKVYRFHCQLCSAFVYLEKKKGGTEVIILWNKWKLWSSHISYRLIRASVTYSKPQCFTRESICAPWPSKLFSVLTVCSVNMTDMLITVLFVAGRGNHLSIHHIYNVI